MAKNDIIQVRLFGIEIGKLGYNLDKRVSYFQYNPEFLASNKYANAFPYIFKRIKPVQVFKQFENDIFRGLPPMIADSLPDVFGNIVFKEWFEAKHTELKKIGILEQLTYVANRGMGALEYIPVAEMPASTTKINIAEIVNVLSIVLDLKSKTTADQLNDQSLLNIFKIGTSAGGARPKILISEHKKTGKIIPGDTEYSNDYNHYLVKLCINEESLEEYNKEKIEYAYYLMAQMARVDMMPSKLIEKKHFATLRFDRQNGEKQHVLTATGIIGWDFKNPDNSSYENLFSLALDIKVPFTDIQQLFRRMVFNLIYGNIDDHLKNHSFIYQKEKDTWRLAPAYDLTYPLNINLNYSKISRALSNNNKRNDIKLQDVMVIADLYAIKNPKGIIKEVQETTADWDIITAELEISRKISSAIKNQFLLLL